MIAPNSTSKPPTPETGVEACLALVEALCGPLLSMEGNPWALEFARRGVPVIYMEGDMPLSEAARTLPEVRALLEQFRPSVEVEGQGVPTTEMELVRHGA